MEEVVVSINQEGTLKVSRRYDLGAFLKQGFGRRSVVDEAKCTEDIEEAEFIRSLKLLFIVALILTAITFIIFESIVTRAVLPMSSHLPLYHNRWLFGPSLIGLTGIVVLVMFAALLPVGILTKNVTRGGILAWLRRRQAPTMSATTEHI